MDDRVPMCPGPVILDRAYRGVRIRRMSFFRRRHVDFGVVVTASCPGPGGSFNRASCEISARHRPSSR